MALPVSRTDTFKCTCNAAAGPTGSTSVPPAPSGSTSTAADLDGLFTTAQPTPQSAPQGATPRLWQQAGPGQSMGGLGSPQAGMGMQGGSPQPAVGMQPGAQMGYMPGMLSVISCVPKNMTNAGKPPDLHLDFMALSKQQCCIQLMSGMTGLQLKAPP